jgi:hypothetical protein
MSFSTDLDKYLTTPPWDDGLEHFIEKTMDLFTEPTFDEMKETGFMETDLFNAWITTLHERTYLEDYDDNGQPFSSGDPEFTEIQAAAIIERGFLIFIKNK